MEGFISGYMNTVRDAIGQIDKAALEAVVDALYQAYLDGRQVFTMGNGASASLAAHMACDLGKGTAPDLGQGPSLSGGRRLRIMSLADNTALLTAYGNDISYEDIFVEQLKNLLDPRDVVIGISGSGSSPNVLRALEYARLREAVTIGFTGAQGDKLRRLCQIHVTAPLSLIEQIEDLHVLFGHIVAIGLRRKVLDSI